MGQGAAAAAAVVVAQTVCLPSQLLQRLPAWALLPSQQRVLAIEWQLLPWHQE